jgi:hypothetical protein
MRAPALARDEEIRIAASGTELVGHLVLPPAPVGVVVFAHGAAAAVTARGTNSWPVSSTTPDWVRCCSTS